MCAAIPWGRTWSHPMKYLLFAIASLPIALAVNADDEVKKDLVAETRTKYRKHSADALKIVEPVKISQVFYYKDGGTVGIELTDAKDKKHSFSLYPPGRTILEEKRKPMDV